MTYDEIIGLSGLQERQDALIDYYLNSVKILEWMYDKDLSQHLIFNDREEFKFNNKLHREDGPAVVMKNGIEKYYIDGVEMQKDEWFPIARELMREKKLGRVVK